MHYKCGTPGHVVRYTGSRRYSLRQKLCDIVLPQQPLLVDKITLKYNLTPLLL